MTMPRGRAWPVIFLLLLAPLIAEVLWGTTTVSEFPVYLIQIGLYGGGAVLIRELVHRWGGGWPSILLLGAAYGAIEEGLLEPNWFTPALQTHPYGVAGGVFWTYAVWNIGYHAVFSITIPIALTELAFPAWRDKSWLGRPGRSWPAPSTRSAPPASACCGGRSCSPPSCMCRPGCTPFSKAQPLPWSSP